ncbi:MORN motif protein (macronuclear) [Tetrahymena thermophila SB210]|uniref:MORN motif protein n=1 Tax=Tetrahymena thermophila (strain SB210) TaxID=312017 RepID=Q22BN0_TETTS|nr:MORN motif protein [Tetrahymena thermophila SB210]EAR82699.3 MORN motif protein [Tetrahymena thermophila SB210]|eukprot:XP_001030362.3 MORN motif protein [Tetrahymena thermophila SB210]
MEQKQYVIQHDQSQTQSRMFQFNNTSQENVFQKSGSIDGFGTENDTQMMGNHTHQATEGADNKYGQTLYKKGQTFNISKDENSNNLQNKGNIVDMDINSQVEFFKNYKLNIRDLFTMEQLNNDPNLKMKKYKQQVFYGIILNSKRHGNGVMVYQNGRIYEGQWENDLKHGRGYEIFPSGSTYDGYYINGKPEGRGTYKYANGEIYEGEWINGMKHGSGIWRGNKGDSYIGEWKFGKTDGYGVHTWLNGDRYEGQFKQCLKHGEGTEKFANGDSYIGNYQNGKPEGYGEYYWVNGSFFKGYFKNGLRHGHGVWKRGPGNSDMYEGEYFNDKKCGYGVFTWSSGNVYKGNYFDDLRNGYGEMYWTDGSFYKGQWERGIQHGEGEMCMRGEPPRRGLFENNVYIRPLEEHEQFNYQSLPNPQSQQNLGAIRTSTNSIKGNKLGRNQANNSQQFEQSYTIVPNSGVNTPKYKLPQINNRNSSSMRSNSIRTPQGRTLGVSADYYDTTPNSNRASTHKKKKIRPSSTIQQKINQRVLQERSSNSSQEKGNGQNNLTKFKLPKRIQGNGSNSRSNSPTIKNEENKRAIIQNQNAQKKIWKSPGIAGLRGRISPI